MALPQAALRAGHGVSRAPRKESKEAAARADTGVAGSARLGSARLGSARLLIVQSDLRFMAIPMPVQLRTITA